jgi:glycosyltransferase involved in cell wall biosynthesis
MIDMTHQPADIQLRRQRGLASEGRGDAGARLHVMMTVNAAWNVWNFRKALIREMIADGHAVTVLAPPDESVPRLEEMGCRFMPLPMSPSGMNPADDAALVTRFRRAFRQHRPDVVLGYTVKNNIFGAIAAKSLGIPFIPNVTGLGTAFLSGKALETLAGLLYRGAFRKLPTVFFQNEDDRDLFVERRLVASEQARVLPGSGIDLDHFAPADLPHPSQGVTFLMIARLLRDKGVVEFVEAARQIRAASPEARFRLMGALGADNVSAIDAKTLKTWVDEGTVEYLGTTHDVRPHIATAHCVVLPSYREGAPRTLIEAAAMARPVIATDVPGCRTVVARDVSGILCAPRSAESLAAAMRRFLDTHHDARLAMGRAGRQRMERHFDEAHVVSAYREAIAAARQRREV